MKNAMFVALTIVLLLGASLPAAAQSRGRVWGQPQPNNLTADQVIYGGQVAIWGVGDWRRENTRRKEIEAQKDVQMAQIEAWDRQNARWAQVALGQTSAHTGRDIRTSETTDNKGNISLSSSVNSPDFRMPQPRHGSSGPMVR